MHIAILTHYHYRGSDAGNQPQSNIAPIERQSTRRRRLFNSSPFFAPRHYRFTIIGNFPFHDASFHGLNNFWSASHRHRSSAKSILRGFRGETILDTGYIYAPINPCGEIILDE